MTIARAALSVVVMLLSSIEATAQRTDVRALVTDLGNEQDGGIRNAAYRTLQQERPPAAVPMLLELLPTWGPNSQELGVQLIRLYDPDTAIPALQRLTRVDDVFLRFRAATDLHRSGEVGHVRLIADSLRAPAVDDGLRLRMLRQLHGVDAADVTAAIAAMVCADSQINVFDAALFHLVQNGHGLDSIAAGEDLAPEHAALLAAARTATGDVAAAAALAAIVGDEPDVVLFRLTKYLDRAPRLGDELTRSLVELTRTRQDIASLRALAEILGRHGGPGVAAALATLLEHDNDLVVRAALDAMAKRGTELRGTELRQLLASTKPSVALSAADLLRRCDDPSGLGRVIEILGSEPTLRAEAVQVLGKFRQRTAVPPLIDALEDPDRGVRESAARGLVTILQALFPYRRFDLATSGYDPDGPATARGAAVRSIRQWWDRPR